MKRFAFVGIAVVTALLVVVDFATGTGFFGDDYLFRAFAQLEQNPLAAFVTDKHGGEYYRPLPMVLWWLLERVGGGRAMVFAAFAFAGHAACAALVAVLGRRLGYSSFAARLAGIVFFLSPAQRLAALWFSASTDVLGTLAALAASICFLSHARLPRVAAVALSAAAFLCKESLAVLPGLLLAVYWVTHPGQGWWRRGLRRVAPHLGCLVAVVVARTLVLHGLGGTNDVAAPWWGRGMQLAAGLVHALTAYAPVPDWSAWLVGLGTLLWATRVGLLDPAGRSRVRFSWVWVLVAVAPLPGAGWVVGARYFYLAAVGLSLLVAQALERTSRLAAGFAVTALAVCGLACGYARAVEVELYGHALRAIRAGIADGLGQGHRLFFVGGAVKDLDLALKLDPALPSSVREAVIIPDVPASFVWLPPAFGHRLDFLLAQPPLPPSGAYRFGDATPSGKQSATIVGLVRREDAPDLEDVVTRLPELRILHLERKGKGFTVVDRTADDAHDD